MSNRRGRPRKTIALPTRPELEMRRADAEARAAAARAHLAEVEYERRSAATALVFDRAVTALSVALDEIAEVDQLLDQHCKPAAP